MLFADSNPFVFSHQTHFSSLSTSLQTKKICFQQKYLIISSYIKGTDIVVQAQYYISYSLQSTELIITLCVNTSFMSTPLPVGHILPYLSHP